MQRFKKRLKSWLLTILESLLEEVKSRKNRALQQQATLSPGAVLLETAQIHNFQSCPSKILLGSGTYVRGELLIYAHGGKIQIGEYCYVGENTKIWSASSITIGNRVLIAHGVNIHDNISHPKDATLRHQHFLQITSTGHPKNHVDLSEAPILIEDDAWIGFNASIMRGVRVGKGAIVGACAFVSKDVPDYTIVAGNPAQPIGSLPGPQGE